MSYQRILLAVDDSPPGLDAARVAIDLAADHGAEVRAITVLHDHVLERALGQEEANTRHRLATAGESVLGWVADLAATRGVACDTVERDGEPFRQILDEADAWAADLIVIGRADRRGASSPYIGSETAHVLEFTDRPVLVVPRADT